MVTKERMINIIYDLSTLQNDMKWSSQKLIMFQVGIIKLCTGSEQAQTSVTSENTPAGVPAVDNKQIENLNYKISRLEKQIAMMENGTKLSTTSAQSVDNSAVKTDIPVPKAEVKKSESVKLRRSNSKLEQYCKWFKS